MTKEEAKEQLKLWLNYLYPDTDIYHAVAMAIKALKAQASLDDVSTAYENGYKQGKFETLKNGITVEIAIDYLRNNGWLIEHDRIMTEGVWIPCSERLPETDRKVIVQTEAGLITDGRWTGDTWFTTDDYTCYKVIAWRPLPVPYREDKDV